MGKLTKKELDRILKEEFEEKPLKKDKRKERIEDIIIGLVIFLVILFIFTGIRVDSISYSYDDICQNEYGENYVYESDADFGRYCIELNYENLTKENAKKFNWTSEEIKEMCSTPDFWELKEWGSGVC